MLSSAKSIQIYCCHCKRDYSVIGQYAYLRPREIRSRSPERQLLSGQKDPQRQWAKQYNVTGAMPPEMTRWDKLCQGVASQKLTVVL